MSRAYQDPAPPPKGPLARLVERVRDIGGPVLGRTVARAREVRAAYPRGSIVVAALVVLVLLVVLLASCLSGSGPAPAPVVSSTPEPVASTAAPTPSYVPTPTPSQTFYYPGAAPSASQPPGITWTSVGGGVESGCDYRTGNLLYRDTRTGAISVVPGGCAAMSSAPSPAPARTAQ